jgi:hypothetical protein
VTSAEQHHREIAATKYPGKHVPGCNPRCGGGFHVLMPGWSHWCLDQVGVWLPTHTIQCSDCGVYGSAVDVNGAVRQHAAHKLAACEAEDDERGTL